MKITSLAIWTLSLCALLGVSASAFADLIVEHDDGSRVLFSEQEGNILIRRCQAGTETPTVCTLADGDQDDTSKSVEGLITRIENFIRNPEMPIAYPAEFQPQIDLFRNGEEDIRARDRLKIVKANFEEEVADCVAYRIKAKRNWKEYGIAADSLSNYRCDYTLKDSSKVKAEYAKALREAEKKVKPVLSAQKTIRTLIGKIIKKMSVTAKSTTVLNPSSGLDFELTKLAHLVGRCDGKLAAIKDTTTACLNSQGVEWNRRKHHSDRLNQDFWGWENGSTGHLIYDAIPIKDINNDYYYADLMDATDTCLELGGELPSQNDFESIGYVGYTDFINNGRLPGMSRELDMYSGGVWTSTSGCALYGRAPDGTEEVAFWKDLSRCRKNPEKLGALTVGLEFAIGGERFMKNGIFAVTGVRAARHSAISEVFCIAPSQP